MKSGVKAYVSYIFLVLLKQVEKNKKENRYNVWMLSDLETNMVYILPERKCFWALEFWDWRETHLVWYQVEAYYYFIYEKLYFQRFLTMVQAVTPSSKF